MKSRWITDRTEMEEVISKCEFCSMAMVDKDNAPYVLHFNFGHKGDFIYMHGDNKGKKVEVLENNNRVCLFFSADHELHHQHEKVACSFSMRYRSVLIYGNVHFIEAKEEKKEALNIIMKQYTGRDDFSYSDPAVNNVKVWKVNIESMEGKAFGH